MRFDDVLDMYNNNDYCFECDSDIVSYKNTIIIPEYEVNAIAFKDFIDKFDFDEITTCEYDCDFSRYELEVSEGNIVLTVIYELTDDGVNDYIREEKRDNQWYLMNM